MNAAFAVGFLWTVKATKLVHKVVSSKICGLLGEDAV